MKKYLAVSAVVALAFALIGCNQTIPPTLLHERGSTIWIMDDTGGRAKSIINGSMPKWIRGTKTAFAYFVEKRPSVSTHRRGILYVADWDNGNQVIAGNPVAVTYSDAGVHFGWSCDGQWLVFESYRDGNWEIYKVRRYGTNLTNLTNNPAEDTGPAWTNAGEQNGKIAFVSKRTGDKDIYVMDENGQGLANLTDFICGMSGQLDKGDDWGPVWASDADHIAFVGTHQAWGNFSPQIYLTMVSQPHSLLTVSNPSLGSYSMPLWEGSEALFYTSYTPQVFRSIPTAKRWSLPIWESEELNAPSTRSTFTLARRRGYRPLNGMSPIA
jgi:Tol biopolymer transport system component